MIKKSEKRFVSVLFAAIINNADENYLQNRKHLIEEKVERKDRVKRLAKYVEETVKTKEVEEIEEAEETKHRGENSDNRSWKLDRNSKNISCTYDLRSKTTKYSVLKSYMSSCVEHRLKRLTLLILTPSFGSI